MMKKDITVYVNSKTSMVDLHSSRLGISGENLQGNLIVKFDDEFVNGTAILEIQRNNEKYYLVMQKENESYYLPILSSLLSETTTIIMQIRITEGTDNESIPVWKSNKFYLKVEEAINAEIPIPEEYDEWIDIANAKLNELDNIDIDVEKIGNTSTVTITKKDGQQETVQILDGEKGDTGEKGEKGDTGSIGPQGPQGPQGIQGPMGPQGKAFTISKTYSSVSEMNADFDNMQVGDYVMIASSVELEDNAKLYVKDEEEWLFISDFSGAMGIQGEQGIQGIQGIQGEQGIQGIQGETGNGIATIQKTSTSGLIDTYTITYTDGNTSTFSITNGKDGEDGEVSQEQLDETNSHLDHLSKVSNLFEKITATGTSVTLNDTSDTIMKLSLDTTTSNQEDTPSPSNPQTIHTINGDNTITISNSNNTKSQTYPINLGDIEVCKIGDYQDVIFKNTINSEYYDSSLELNKWYKLNNIGKLVLDGNEDYDRYSSLDTANYNCFYLTRNNFFVDSTGTITTTISNYFLGQSFNDRSNNIANMWVNKFASQLYFKVPNTITTSSELKTWLNTHNTMVYYVLATPTYTLLNNTLQTQLDSIQYALAYDTQTNISQTNTDLPFIINAETYVKIGGGGTSDYTNLTNKPKINNVELNGNKSLNDLGIQPAGNYLTEETDPTVPSHVKNITQANITSWNNKSDFSGNYNDLSNKPTIPSEVTESTVSGWGFTKNTGTYSKPSGGIPKTDLASAVQTSLGKADTALQSISSSDVTSALGYTPYNSTNPNGYTSNVGTITGITMNGASKGASGVVDLGTVITSHQDISGKANKISVVQTSASTIEINPNTFYKFGEVASLTITLASITDNTIYNEYMFEFVSGSTATTLTLPSSIKWLETPTIDANKIYQCSIVDNIGLLVGVTNV